jgi:hypothetical protein
MRGQNRAGHFGTGWLSRSDYQVEMDLAVQYNVVTSATGSDDVATTTWAGAC